MSQWIAIPDNPIQRNTERHAAKAKHLRTPLSIHSIVYAAELADGSLVKLDGHTRALLWKRNEIPHPPHVLVNVVPVNDMEEAKHLYQTLDSKDAVETQRDKVSGGFNELNYAPTSSLIAGGAITGALRIAWAAAYDLPLSLSHGHGRKKGDKVDIYLLTKEFANELYALDSFNLHTGDAAGGVVAAFLMSYRKHSDAILPFWHAVFSKGGEKTGGLMDGVQALVELMLVRKGHTAGSSATLDLCSRAINCVEKWIADESFTSMPRPMNIEGYIRGKQPQYRLVKPEKVAKVAATA